MTGTRMHRAMSPFVMNAHRRECRSIMTRVVIEKINPPRPLPAAAMPEAAARFFENHWDSMGRDGTKRKPNEC